jgi:hypothetical protein
MKHLTLACIALAAMSLAACTPVGEPADDIGASSSRDVDVDEGVSFQGVVQEAGISIYMQGTHRLSMADDRFVLLESDVVDLDAYIGEEVEVFGDARATAEGDARIVDVAEVTVLSEGTASSEGTLSSSASSMASSAASSIASSVTAPPAPASAARSSVRPSSRPPAASSPAAASTISESDQMTRARAMAKSNMAPANWTREYCAPQFGFCLPIHRNWYYNSFGTTTSYLWHIEMSNEHPDAIGTGPLSVNLVSGAAATQGATDRQVVTKGEFVVGYRDWKNGNHFEIIAPLPLEAGVRYITEQLKESPASSSSAGSASSRSSSAASTSSVPASAAASS